MPVPADTGKKFLCTHGAIIRADTAVKKIALVFTADESADGAGSIIEALRNENLTASFFLTGRFYRNKQFAPVIKTLLKNGHYLGAHSDKHLLYCDWDHRDSLLVTKEQFQKDLQQNYQLMWRYHIRKASATYFLPPYEWYNDTIAAWTSRMGLQLINNSPGTLSAADYTWPQLKNYRSSEEILQSIQQYALTRQGGLNGFILLLHLGTDSRRTDKFYTYLPQLLHWLTQQGYYLVRIDELLK